MSIPISVSAASLQSIGRLAGDVGSEAIGIAANGSVVVGNPIGVSSPRAIVWTVSVLTPLPPQVDTFLFEEGISGDGTAVVGSILEIDGLGQISSSETFRWRAGTGSVGLADLPGGSDRSVAFSCSSSGGDRIVGESLSGEGRLRDRETELARDGDDGVRGWMLARTARSPFFRFREIRDRR